MSELKKNEIQNGKDIDKDKDKDSPMSLDKQEGVLLAYQKILNLRKRIQQDQGMSRLTFFFGVMNVSMTCYLFGTAPEYYWILFIVKIFVIAPTRLYIGYSNKDNYYLTDFCWTSIFFTALSFLIMAFNLVPYDWSVHIKKIMFVFANGPQGWSVVIFSNAVVFHSFQHTCSVFIHLTPVLASYSLRWHFDKIHKVYPGLFYYDQKELQSFYSLNKYFAEFFFPAFKLYMLWWLIYTFWLCYHGLGLPSKGYDTVFNWIYTTKDFVQAFIDKIALRAFKKEKSRQTKTKVLIFMSMHFLVFVTTMLWGYICVNYQVIHQIFILFLLSSVIWQASGFYVYFSLNGPKKEIEKIIIQHQIMPVAQQLENEKKKRRKRKFL